MYKRILAILIGLLSFSNIALAGNFTTLADTGRLNLNEDEKWEKAYDTASGQFKIRFRKLLLGSDDKKYHLIVWWNKKRIADGYCPNNRYGYEFKVYKDNSTDRVYVDFEAVNRAVLFGYDPKNNKLEKYVDSVNYWSPDSGPKIIVDEDKDLQLRFVEKGTVYCPKYKLFWDNKANWFGYKDVTVQRPVYTAPSYDYTPSYDSGSSSSSASSYEYEEVEYEEVFYEGS
jgi:hypothetical protein